MNKMVDMQKAFGAVCKYFHLGNAMECNRLYRALEEAYELTTQPEQKWVPVTERMPKDGAEVWVTTEMLFDVTRACWHKDSNLWCHPYDPDCLLALRPIAWMEMSFPEPYKGVKI